jgi:gliding motility associated protien GldN
MWSKRIWRELDMRQKMNQSFYYPLEPHNNWRNFITVVMDALKEGSITAYDISSTDEFLVPLTFQEILTRQIDTVHRTLTRPYPPYDQYDTVIFSEFDPGRVMKLRVKEDWYFDKKRSQMMVRILGICPVMIKERNGEEFSEPLFWIYFPEARPVFAQAEIFNRYNDAARRSYDEVFMKRIFSSYIYKEQNAYDRRISEYAQGLDALLEAERIKQQLIDFEQSLWEY